MNVNLTPRGGRPVCCPYCREAVLEGRGCRRCATLYHYECARILGSCALLGCEGRVSKDLDHTHAFAGRRRLGPFSRAARSRGYTVRWRRVGAVAGAAFGVCAAVAFSGTGTSPVGALKTIGDAQTLRWNEDQAIGALRTIPSHQTLWREGDQDDAEPLDYSALAELAELGNGPSLIDSVLEAGTRSGYAFEAVDQSLLRPWSAIPASPDDVQAAALTAPDNSLERSDRYFEVNTEGVIFYTTPATLEVTGGPTRPTPTGR